MIEDKDIKMGNIVYMDETSPRNSKDIGLWEHVSLYDGYTYLSESSSKVEFEILDVKDSVHIKPTSAIFLPNHIPVDDAWIWKDEFKRNFSLCHINEKREELRANGECKGVYPSDKLISIIEDVKTAKFALSWIYDILSNKKNLKEANSFPLDEFNDEFMNTIFSLIAECLKKKNNE